MTLLSIQKRLISAIRRPWNEESFRFYRILYLIIIPSAILAIGLGDFMGLAINLVMKSTLNPFQAFREVYIDTFKNVFERQVSCAQHEREKVWSMTKWHVQTFSYYQTCRVVVQGVLSAFRLVLIILLAVKLPSLVSIVGNQLEGHGGSTAFNHTEILEKARFLLWLAFLGWMVPPVVAMSSIIPMRLVIHSDSRIKSISSRLKTPMKSLIVGQILKRYQQILLFGFFTLFIGLIIQLTLGGIQPRDSEWLIAIYSVLMIVFAFVATEGAIRMSSTLINRVNIMWSTDSTIVVILLALLGKLGQHVSILGKPTTRRSIINTIESLALQFELFLPAQILGTNYKENALYAEFCCIANGIRRTELEIANPKSGLWSERLRQDLSLILTSFILMRWADLPRGSGTGTHATASLTKQLLEVLKAGATGAIPGVTLFLFQKTSYGFSGQLLELTTLAAIGWFIISAVLRLDPEFSAKAKALREVRDIIKP